MLKILIFVYNAKLYEEKLKEKYPHLIIKTWCRWEDCDDFIEEADILICVKISDELLKKAKKLKWIQLLSAGYDHILSLSGFRKDIILSTAKDIHHIPIAEYVLGYMLSICHKSFDYMKAQKEKKWVKIEKVELTGKTLGLIGLGSIGREIARRAKAFDMKVLGVKRSYEKIDFVDEIFTPDRLDEVLTRSDFLILALPSAPSTHNLIGEEEIKKMKPSAHLINIARGEILDEHALSDAIKNKKLAGAVLDVFREEPLPSESELWDMDNLIITPHISWVSDYTVRRITDLLLENIGRYIKGEEIRYQLSVTSDQ